MRVRVRYFAVVRERLRRDEEWLELPAGASVAGALDALTAQHGEIAALRAHLRVAVNQEMVEGGAAAAAAWLLGDGDELALIPPVAGGSDGEAGGEAGGAAAAARPRHARLVGDRAPSVDACVAAVGGAGMGGIGG